MSFSDIFDALLSAEAFITNLLGAISESAVESTKDYLPFVFLVVSAIKLIFGLGLVAYLLQLRGAGVETRVVSIQSSLIMAVLSVMVSLYMLIRNIRAVGVHIDAGAGDAVHGYAADEDGSYKGPAPYADGAQYAKSEN